MAVDLLGAEIAPQIYASASLSACALIHFARFWGYGGIHIVNLYAFRASKPEEMYASTERVGPENGRHIEDAIEYARTLGDGRVLVAWGNGPSQMQQRDLEELSRADWFCARALGRVGLICLGKTQSGAPKHPMARGTHRIARDQQPVVFQGLAR